MEFNALVALVLLVIVFLSGLWAISNLMLQPKKLSYDKLYEREVAEGRLNVEAYQSMYKTEINITSNLGYQLSCQLLETEDTKQNSSDKKIAVLCHGFTCAKYSSVLYAEIFLKLGFTVLIYDHRNHGLSGKAYTSMGYYEKQDLKKVIDWCCENYGEDCKIVTHGESMGAATVISHLEIDQRVKCVIADCAYSDLRQLLKYQLKQYFHIPFLLLSIESLIIYLRAGFWYGEVSPIRAVSHSNTPILFIHGMEDKYVPAIMSKEMYQCKKGPKEIYLVEGAKHAGACKSNYEEYEKRVKDFINKFLISQTKQ